MASDATLQTAPAGKWPSDNDTLYEVVDGRRVELLPMGAFETDVASALMCFLGPFARKQQLGRAVMEMLFRLDRIRDLQRRPDLAFVSYQRWPRGRRVPRTAAWDVVPELAVEVVSPTNTAEEILVKVREYFEAGVQRVWVVYPVERQVYIYESPVKVRILQVTDELDGEPVVPGFRLSLTTFFEEESESGQADAT